MQHFSPGETLKAQTGDWRAARKKYLTHGPAWHLHELCEFSGVEDLFDGRPLDGMVLTPWRPKAASRAAQRGCGFPCLQVAGFPAVGSDGRSRCGGGLEAVAQQLCLDV